MLILALLSMFGLIGVAFVVLTSQAQRGAKSIERIDLASDPPPKLLHQAALQVFRGSTNPASVMGAHSLLEDMYGDAYSTTYPTGYVTGTISGATSACGGQLLQITASSPSAAVIALRGGCVLTITGPTTSPAFGQSTRIVYVDTSNATAATVYVMAFPNETTIATPAVLAGATFTINGVPFSGTGFGYQADGSFNDNDALLNLNPVYSTVNRNPLGGANEDYDAADFQNMLLAAQVYDSTNNRFNTIPSLHRPALVRANPSGTLHNYVLRPLLTDHPNFTGSNQNFDAAWDGVTTTDNRQWDVDNDGDGVPDSVWVDLGMPARATADGRLYKPLFAILCVDLDGRLNLNAHGSLAQTASASFASLWGNSFSVTPDAPATENTARGQGVGPGEINLGALLTTPAYVMTGITGGYRGRYGAPGAPGVSGLDALSANKWFDYSGSYGSPIDPFGVGAVGLDQAGRPAYMKSGVYGFGSGIENLPYEFNLGANVGRGLPSSTTGNNPFSAAELERLLRPFDRDATGLPERLATLTSSDGNPANSELLTAARRKAFTTDSWDVPCPAVAMKNILTSLSARCTDQSLWPQFLPAEVLAGLKMNINRPFGNGTTDGSTAGVVDDPTVTTARTVTLYDSASTTVSPTMSYDGRDSTSTLAATSLAARQLEARHLYIMACLTADLTYLNAQFGSDHTKTARFLAQWAVNAVDFRDRDSIMTWFDYDPNWADPSKTFSSGWSVTAGTSPRVWGCERPELLITETLAFHDRRTKNTSDETAPFDTDDGDSQDTGGTTADAATTASPHKYDATYDQSYRPQGSLFVELYNPSSKLEPHCKDLYTAADSAGELNIVKTVGGSPVWRLVIAKPTGDNEQPDPDDPDSYTVVVDREVYFVQESAVTNLPTTHVADVRFYPTATPSGENIGPGEYAVVGPGEPTAAAAKQRTTYIGFLDSGTSGTAGTRQVDLDQATKLVENNTNSPADPTTGILPVKTIAIDSPRRLSVSEPVDGYESFESGAGPDNDGRYTTAGVPTAYDRPFDCQRGDGGQTFFVANGTYPKYRVVYLQRLANPLATYNGDHTSANYNPYRTIDMMSIDVTSFNGVCQDEGNATANEDDPQLPVSPPSGMIATHFQSRQRGERNDDNNANNVWKQEPVEKPVTVFTALGDAATVDTHYFESDLKHSLGYLNQPFGTPTTTPYTGAPSKPFPWLTWNNRPWVSPLELLLVPAVRSSKLLVNAASSAADKAVANATYNKYFNILKLSDTTANPYSELNGANVPYPHLLNFFQSSASTANSSAQFHRILEYLGTPSPFVGAEVQTDPSTAATATDHPFRPPFNRISNYREPGRINLNTIYNQYVFNGLMAGFPGMATDNFWQRFVASRQGNTALTDNVLGYVASYPSEFAHPFRSFGGWTMTPSGIRPTREIDCTLLRSDPIPTDANRPLFAFDSTDFDAAEYVGDYNNPERNPYFRYQSLARLANLVTTRSNVYAVWITVGYFEYSPTAGLGRELGADTGEIDRHRAFYIFDRSIPVGFQRGQDLNVEKAILVRRYIE